MKHESIPKARCEVFPKISVVIPTIGRPELIRALRSVRAQSSVGTIEIIVVNDAPPGIELSAEVFDLADHVLRTPGKVGGSRARNLGIKSATGTYVALLDDDDEWLPRKLSLQVALLQSLVDPARAVVAGRQLYVNPSTGEVSDPGPRRLIAPGEKVEHYLFRRRPPSLARPSMYTSSLLCSRQLAVKVPWDESLPRHQDWDWLIRLGRIPGSSFAQTAEPVVRIQLGSALSISAGTDWRSSLDWADRALRRDPKVYVDFLAGQALRYALTARSGEGVRKITASILKTGRLPAVGPTVVGAAGVLPRKTFERAIVASGGGRRTGQPVPM
ncbi:glycosyltransferase family 2 protein [Mycobacterium sp. Root265]|uniref:glycosyltransferase family 2 protein n=1 Tax=Mycobacterium sp. Root265 TaxID=1736504 RepID=UPI00138EDBFC|nr:glycosyltransferase family 2 protein [Mycobacterium sp. Root265]